MKKRPLPVDVRRSKTLLLKLPKVSNVALTLAYVTRVHDDGKRVLSVASLHHMIQSDVKSVKPVGVLICFLCHL